jgi:hypothetical protein
MDIIGTYMVNGAIAATGDQCNKISCSGDTRKGHELKSKKRSGLKTNHKKIKIILSGLSGR